ncbi:long-chain acyl-CoA synthetase [Nocardia jinanensis]|uniref:Long-chain acyl-CoA synthetase n=1 Tax=Nocardia jinanensis TaxID=382504 RepID=A0A917RLN2_9NOCA|nr:long-chain acyl-CoA synthetase [Nocardia jinanensis]
MMTNEPGYFEVAWAAQRCGLFYTPVNWHLTAAEAAYIVRDCGASVLIASAALGDLAEQVAAEAPALHTRLMVGGDRAGFEDYARAVAEYSTQPPAEQVEGHYMFYSSGTTGRPKGITVALTGEPFGTGLTLDNMMPSLYGFGCESVYLCTGPLYHAAPLGWSLGTQRGGGTVVVMERFDAATALESVQLYGVTHAQFVPAMFVRMLKLPERTRRAFDLSTLVVAVHAAAPCPIAVKEAMIEWWGPILHEYYAGSESNAFSAIDSPTWLEHKGSVGKTLIGVAHILDELGNELPSGEVGTVWFSGGPRFEYHNDPAKTAAAYDARGRSTLGDMGWLDEEGFLYLADRRTDLIISGGVNIYPKEIEDVLVLHPAVADVAVIGIPDEEMGRQVRAVIEAQEANSAGPELAAELIEYCRSRLAHFKCPRAVDFVAELPRLPSGKILKRVIRERYDRAHAAESRSL